MEVATDGGALTIVAFDGARNLTLNLVVSESKHRSVFRDSNGDYGIVASRLRVADGQLLLDDEASSEFQSSSQSCNPECN